MARKTIRQKNIDERANYLTSRSAPKKATAKAAPAAPAKAKAAPAKTKKSVKSAPKKAVEKKKAYTPGASGADKPGPRKVKAKTAAPASKPSAPISARNRSDQNDYKQKESRYNADSAGAVAKKKAKAASRSRSPGPKVGLIKKLRQDTRKYAKN